MKILITGSNGFIGGNLRDFYLKSDKKIFTPKRNELDLLNKVQVSDYLLSNQFDIVIHSAVTLTSIEENINMYFNLEACSKHYGKLICIGSGAEYDKNHYIPKMQESYFDKFIPSKEDIYGYSKYIIAKDIIDKSKNIFNLRLFGIFGKYEDHRRRLISNNICKKLCGEKVSINKNGYFDYMYIDDFCLILDKFITQKPRQNTYNVCTGKIVDFITIAKIINNIEYNGEDIEVKHEGASPEYSGDNSIFVNEFGDINFTNIELSIKKLYEWYKYKSGLIFDHTIFDRWNKAKIGN